MDGFQMVSGQMGGSMTNEQLRLIVGFASSLMSGALAGWIAGRILLRSQSAVTTVHEDATHLLDMVQALESAYDKCAADVFFADYTLADTGSSDPKAATKAHGDKHAALQILRLAWDELSNSAARLRAPSNVLLKKCVINITRAFTYGRDWTPEQPDRALADTEELLAMLEQFLSPPSFWQRLGTLVSWALGWMRSSERFREFVLVAVARGNGEVHSLKGRAIPVALSGYTLQNPDRESAITSAVAQLEQDGLLRRKTDAPDTLVLTSTGWLSVSRIKSPESWSEKWSNRRLATRRPH